MSYGPLLRSLANTPKGDGDNYRTVAGTLLRQAFNEGAVPSQRRFIADLRSVGWGGRNANIAQVYNLMLEILNLSVSRESQHNTNLNTFNRPPPTNWRKTERARVDQYINHAVIIFTIRGIVGAKLWGSPSKSLITTFAACSQNRDGYVNSTPTNAQGENEYEEVFITLEYAGVRHLVRR